MRRVLLVPVLCVAALALLGGSAAVAKHKPPPKPKVGQYLGTTSNGIDVTIVLNKGRTSGSISYCGLGAPFTVSGKSFSVAFQDPVTGESISGDGTFKAKRKRSGKVVSTVAGSLGPSACDASPQTFSLRG